MQKNRVMKVLITNAGKIASILGVLTAIMQIANRSYIHMTLTVDEMTLSGVALFLSSMVLFPADKHSWLKRVSGGLGIIYVVFLVADAHDKVGFWGIVFSCLMPMVVSFAMLFERGGLWHQGQDLGKHLPRSEWQKMVYAFKRAPIFWTSIVSFVTKIGALWYGIANHEVLYIPAVLLACLENLAIALMDNRIRHLFGMYGAKDNQ